MDEETESYLLLLLSDGNLPTGSFVASAGLESYVKHGFFTSSIPTSSFTTSPSPPTLTRSTIAFIRDSLHTYSRSTLPFIVSVHQAVQAYGDEALSHNETMQTVKDLDGLYETMTLNHVARRASTAQGVALLTLMARGLVRPTWLDDSANPDHLRVKKLEAFVGDLKLQVRRGDTFGHLPVCWAVLTAALGLSCERSQHLHLFLHARSLVSASIRLNTLGPYAAQQLLLHVVRPLIHASLEETKRSPIPFNRTASASSEDTDTEIHDDGESGPASTWPLGEILAARHDLQHSRIFNS